MANHNPHGVFLPAITSVTNIKSYQTLFIMFTFSSILFPHGYTLVF